MYRAFGKRCLDIGLSLAGIALAAPLMAAAAAAVKLDSPGPVLFRQARLGRDGRLFRLLKFRSMRPAREGDPQFEPGGSSRITRTGRILRRTKIDELPQLFNVLRGDMSLVGPRPEVPQYKDHFTGRFAEVLSIRPGITDPASIKYRKEEELLSQAVDPGRLYVETVLPDKLGMALDYVKGGITLKQDIKIIFKTIQSVLERTS